MPIISGFPVGGNAKLPEGGKTDQVLIKTKDGESWGNVKTVEEGNTQTPISFQIKGIEGEEFIIEFTEDAPADSEGVSSFNGRSGDVIPQAGDYTAEMVGARSKTWLPTLTEIGAVSETRTVNKKPLSSNIELNASDVGAVSIDRTINGKPLSGNIVLAASDVNADPTGSASTALENAKSYTDQAIQKAIINAIGGSY